MVWLKSKWFSVGERLYDLIIINLLMIMGSFMIVTIAPSLLAGIQVIYGLRAGNSEGLFIEFLKWYRRCFFKGMVLNLLMLMWFLVFKTIFQIFISQGSLAGIVITCLFAVEITMSLLASLHLLLFDDTPDIFKLIKRGFSAFNRHWYLYFTFCTLFAAIAFLLIVSKVFTPIAISGSIYLLECFKESRSLKSDGDTPSSFLKVLEKTN